MFQSVYSRFVTLYNTLKVPLILLELDVLNSTENVRTIHKMLNQRNVLTYAFLKDQGTDVSLVCKTVYYYLLVLAKLGNVSIFILAKDCQNT